MTDNATAAMVVSDSTSLAQTTGGVLDAISRAAADPTVNVDKLERLLAIQQTLLADGRRQSFMAAKSRLQALLPQINKTGRIVVKGTERSRYAKLEDIDTAIRPLLADEGFAFSFDSESKDGKLFTFSCELSHRDGHSETKTLMLPLDKSDYRSDIQSIGSAETYAKRRLIKMHLNIIERDEDDDGNGGQRPVTALQASTLRAGMASFAAPNEPPDVTSAREGKFLNWLGAPSFETILAGNFERALKFIEEKKRGSK